jgi:lipopolysaccharide/colanic/teichoic acid biosynthesis glycosyltransferase
MDLVIVNRPKASPIRKEYQIAKRVMDIALCLLILPLALPLLVIIAILVYVDSPGPVIFTQLRTGKGGRRFPMYKFRTMVPNAEELKAKYAHLNELSPPDFKITNDPRVTRVGRILRKTSLDELPQLYNILEGTMSWVGPRPTSFSADTYHLWHTERLEVQPGLTGLWQVSGRSDVDFDERLRLDIEYIERQSLWFDIRILLRTVEAVISRKGAC